MTATTLFDKAVEAGAQAACKACDLDWDKQDDPQTSAGGGEEKDYYRNISRAALLAALAVLRVPDEGMIDKGDAEFYEWMPPSVEWTRPLVKSGWQAMLDHLIQSATQGEGK